MITLENKTALVTARREESVARQQRRLLKLGRMSWFTMAAQDRKRSLSLSRSGGKVAMQMQSQPTWELQRALRCSRNRCALLWVVDWMCSSSTPELARRPVLRITQ